jgi:hypothetical protein
MFELFAGEHWRQFGSGGKRPGNILAHTSIPWTDTFRESESVAAIHAETLGVRSFDLLHVGLALTLKAIEFLTCDVRQATLAKAAGLKVKP